MLELHHNSAVNESSELKKAEKPVLNETKQEMADTTEKKGSIQELKKEITEKLSALFKDTDNYISDVQVVEIPESGITSDISDKLKSMADKVSGSFEKVSMYVKEFDGSVLVQDIKDKGDIYKGLMKVAVGGAAVVGTILISAACRKNPDVVGAIFSSARQNVVPLVKNTGKAIGEKIINSDETKKAIIGGAFTLATALIKGDDIKSAIKNTMHEGVTAFVGSVDIKKAENSDNNETKFNETAHGELKNAAENYFSDLKERSEFSNTIPDKPFDVNTLEKRSPESLAQLREAFNDCKNELKKQWEVTHGCPWPKYDTDIYSDKGNLIRVAGSDYDAHHIKPLSMGGENTVNNITPLHANEHFDRQGIHAYNSPYNIMENILGGKTV